MLLGTLILIVLYLAFAFWVFESHKPNSSVYSFYLGVNLYQFNRLKFYQKFYRIIFLPLIVVWKILGTLIMAMVDFGISRSTEYFAKPRPRKNRQHGIKT